MPPVRPEMHGAESSFPSVSQTCDLVTARPPPLQKSCVHMFYLLPRAWRGHAADPLNRRQSWTSHAPARRSPAMPLPSPSRPFSPCPRIMPIMLRIWFVMFRDVFLLMTNCVKTSVQTDVQMRNTIRNV